MEIYVYRDQLVFRGKVKDLVKYLRQISKEYHTLQELIAARLQ